MKHRLRLGVLLLAILTVAALLAGCSNVNNGGNESSGPDSTTVTEKPDERLDLAEYSLIRPDRSSGYLTDAFRGLRNNIRDRFGIDLTVSDDWLLEGDYDSERVAALPEVLIGDVNRPEAKKAAEGIEKNEWRISRAGAKIVISGGSEFALGAAMNAFFEALSGAEKTDGGKLLFAPAELSGAVNTQYLVGLTDQKNSTVRVCDLTGASISVADSIWSYKYEYYNIADTRLREYNGREVVLAAYGGNSASMVSFDDKKEVLWRTDSTASNPHACELIPCGVIAVAASNGGEVRFFDAAGDGKSYVSAKLTDSHGLLWDPTAGVLWAVGDNVLTAYEVTLEGGRITVNERTDLRTVIPSGGAHDLQPYYGDSDRMWITTVSAVYVYSKSAGQFLTDYPGSDKIMRKSVKGIGNFDDGSVVLITPDGGFRSWTGKSVDFYVLADGTYSYIKVDSADGGFYKVRVWNKNYQ